MKREIRGYLFDIILMFGIIIGSFPLWNTFASRIPDFDSYKATGLNLATVKPIGANIISTEAEADPGIIIVHNAEASSSTSTLFLKFNRESTLDYRKISVKMNDEIINLDNVLMTMDNEYYIFMLTDITLPGYSNKEYTLSIWVDPNQEDIYNKLFDYQIVLG